MTMMHEHDSCPTLLNPRLFFFTKNLFTNHFCVSTTRCDCHSGFTFFRSVTRPMGTRLDVTSPDAGVASHAVALNHGDDDS